MQSIESTSPKGRSRPKGGRKEGSKNVPREFDPSSLLCPRAVAARALAISERQIINLEKSGVLTPVRLVAGGMVYYRTAQIVALALGEAA
jgi:hypothetical protein